ncbi:MAG TPA: GNAT family N-acetyltransferase [Ilumatobacter sp.]|nr:GNAT family N-acetyltransferase [Ilumatobacter sp.]
MNDRLQSDLTAAMRRRDASTVRVLRTVLAAVANAEAVDAVPTHVPAPAESPIAGAAHGLGATDVARRELTDAEVVAIVRGERDERLAAAAELAANGHTARAAKLRVEAALLDPYLETFAVEVLPVDEVRPLRLAVLRHDTPTKNVVLPGDDHPDTRHLAIRTADGRVVATSSWSEQESPDRPGARALQLRGMAVAHSHHRLGLGSQLIDAGRALAAERGIGLLWANARDSALDFYVAEGFDIVGEGFVTADTQLPHHRILRQL